MNRSSALCRAPKGASARVRSVRPLAGVFLSVLGSTPPLFREPAMGRFVPKTSNPVRRTPSDMPLTSREWCAIRRELRLSPQQTRIVGQILLGKGDKQIAVILTLSKNTVRTHLSRIYARLKVDGRIGLLLRILRVLPRSNALRGHISLSSPVVTSQMVTCDTSPRS